MKIKKCLISVLLVLTALNAFGAEKSKKIQPRFALVIGNQNYDVSRLDNPINDAALMKKTLEDNCFEVFYYTDLDHDGMLSAIEAYSERVNSVGRDSVSLLYYSGHGVQLNGENYLVPVNDKDIDTVIKAENKCFAVKKLFDYINSGTQIFILDACRNNPFSTKKEIFTKGLSQIQSPKGINFMYLFSTQAGETAEDGKDRNSIFTKILAQEIMQPNLPVTTVFSNVSLKVGDASGGKQRPLYTGSAVDFEFMNESIASWKLAELKKRSDSIKVEQKTEKSTEKLSQFKTEQNFIDAQIKIIELRREESKKDAEQKAKVKKEQDERSRALAKETEKTRKEAEKLRRQAQENRAKEQSSIAFINVIEQNKQRLQKIRAEAFSRIVAENEACDAETELKIQEIKNQEHSITDYDSKGNLIRTAQKAQEAKIQSVKDEGEKKKNKNFEIYSEPIAEEENSLVKQIDKDYNTLKNAGYTASSFIDELSFSVLNQYDGDKKRWTIKVESSLFDEPSLIVEKIDIPYQALGNKMNESADEYDTNVNLYDTLLRNTENSPFEVRIDYTLKPIDGKPSVYRFNATKLSAYYHAEDGKERRLNSKQIMVSREIAYNGPRTEIKDISQMLKDYNREKDAEARQKLADERNKKSKEAVEKAVDSVSSGFSKLEDIGGPQIPVSGLLAGFSVRSEMYDIQFGYSFPLGNNFYIGPALLLGGAKDYDYSLAQETTPTVFGIAGFTGFCLTFDVASAYLVRPDLTAVVRYDTVSKAGFSILAGCDVVFASTGIGAGIELGADFCTEKDPSFLFSLNVKFPLSFLQDLI